MLPSEFLNLKKSVMRHQHTITHQKNLKKINVELNDPNVKLKVLRTAYHVVKNGYAHEEFPNLIFLQTINNSQMGNTNHSTSLIQKVRNELHITVLNNIKNFVEKTPCVAFVADKVTVNRRCYDILALQIIATEAPSNQMIQSIVIGAPLVG